MAGGPPTPGFIDSNSVTGQGSGFCFQLSEFSPYLTISFTLNGAGINVSCENPGSIACGWFVDTTPGGTIDGPINGGARISNWEDFKADCTGGSARVRYDEGTLNLLGVTSLFLRSYAIDACGLAYSTSIPIGPFNPTTSTDIEVVTNTGFPIGTVLFTTTHDDDTGGELPIGLYTVTFSPTDDVTDQGLDIDGTGISWEIWTMPSRGGDLLAAGGGLNSRQTKTTPIIVDKDLIKALDQLNKNDASGVKKCFTRYVHIFNGGCNESDIATYTVCIQPWKNDVQGEHLVHVRNSTNHEENVFYSDDVPVFAEQDLKDDINLFPPATAYRPDEPNGFWTWGGSIDASTRSFGTNDDDDDHPENDVGPPDPVTGIPPPENEPPPGMTHWVNIHVETDPGGPLTPVPGVQAQAIIGFETMTNDISLKCS